MGILPSIILFKTVLLLWWHVIDYDFYDSHFQNVVSEYQPSRGFLLFQAFVLTFICIISLSILTFKKSVYKLYKQILLITTAAAIVYCVYISYQYLSITRSFSVFDGNGSHEELMTWNEQWTIIYLPVVQALSITLAIIFGTWMWTKNAIKEHFVK